MLLCGFLLGLFCNREDGGGRFFRNVGWLSTDCPVLYPRNECCLKDATMSSNIQCTYSRTISRRPIHETLRSKGLWKLSANYVNSTLDIVHFTQRHYRTVYGYSRKRHAFFEVRTYSNIRNTYALLVLGRFSSSDERMADHSDRAV
jgi:hypothetical protein